MILILIQYSYKLDFVIYLQVRLQTMPPVQPGKVPIYTGAWDCAVKTVKKEGFFGLYKGIII